MKSYFRKYKKMVGFNFVVLVFLLWPYPIYAQSEMPFTAGEQAMSMAKILSREPMVRAIILTVVSVDWEMAGIHPDQMVSKATVMNEMMYFMDICQALEQQVKRGVSLREIFNQINPSRVTKYLEMYPASKTYIDQL